MGDWLVERFTLLGVTLRRRIKGAVGCDVLTLNPALGSRVKGNTPGISPLSPSGRQPPRLAAPLHPHQGRSNASLLETISREFGSFIVFDRRQASTARRGD